MDKKKIIVSILIVSLIILSVAGVTSAFFISRTNESGAGANSSKLDINYVAPEDITGELGPSSTRDGGLKATASASLAAGSEKAAFNMYITPTSLTKLNIPALKWEVEGIKNGETIYTNSGDFSTGKVNTAIKIVDGQMLDTTSITFNVYIWLDEKVITSPLSGASFGAKISVDSVPITGEFEE